MKNKNVVLFLLTLFLGGLLMGCNGNGVDLNILNQSKGKKYEDTSIKYLSNSSVNNHDCGGFNKSSVKDQWDTGMADPYILRYNGTYYVYVTTSGANSYGLRAWKSKDLINWSKCQGEGLKEGYVVSDVDEGLRYTQNAYAPEVYYFNGKFYLIISPGPSAAKRGHYVLVADNPEGPFEYYAGPLDTRIDGSVLIDDDESIYFLHATDGGITMMEFENFNTLKEGSLILASDQMGGWTEGPGLCKINNTYYLTYTGLHYQTPGYQVCYAVSTHLDKNDLAHSFVKGPTQPMLINCDVDEGHVGLGHSINFLGPDLDSHYICYHNLDELYSDGMTHRSFNIDRLLVNDGLMTCVQNKTDTIYPDFPIFSSNDNKRFNKVGNKLISDTKSNNIFSAEFNSKGGKDVNYIFSYIDDDNYAYIKPCYSEHKIKLFVRNSGNDSLISEGNLKNNFDINDNHTIRLSYDGKLNVYFDEMKKMEISNIDLNGGSIGYEFTQDDYVIGYSAISKHANGSSDRAQIKQALGDIPASAYMLNNQQEGVISYQLSNGSGLIKCTGNSEYSATSELLLNKKYDFTRYLINVKEDGQYGIELVLNKKELGKSIAVEIDDQEHQIIKLPNSFETDEDYVRVLTSPISVSKGFHEIKFQNIENSFSFVSFGLRPISEVNYENNLSSTDGLNVVSGSYTANNGELEVSGKRAFLPLTNRNVKDFELSIDVKFAGSTFMSTPIGIAFRQSNYANAEVPGQKFVDYNYHIQCYYLEVGSTGVSLYKYNFGKNKSYLLQQKIMFLTVGEFHNIRVVAVDNTFAVYLGKEEIIVVSDPLAFTTGAVGLYSFNGSGSYKNVKIISK